MIPAILPLIIDRLEPWKERLLRALPGLTEELRETLRVLDRRMHGGTGTFVPISWARWMEWLNLRSLNAAKTRLARLEAMGLLEALSGGCGPEGSRANRYRLRWSEDGQPTTHVFQAAMGARARRSGKGSRLPREGYQPSADTPAPRYQPADAPLSGYQRADTPSLGYQPPADTPAPSRAQGYQPTDDTPPLRYQTSAAKGDQHADTPHPGYQPAESPKYQPSADPGYQRIWVTPYQPADTPSFKERIESTKVQIHSISQSIQSNQDVSAIEATDGLMDRSMDSAFDWRPWLKGRQSDPWPESLLDGLKEILTPVQVPDLQRRSPWSAEGAWAILQGVRAMGAGLSNKAGTLWNALVRVDKGAPRLERSGPLLRAAGWRMEPEDGTPEESLLRARLGRQLSKEGLARLPLSGEGLERHRRLVSPASDREKELELSFEEDDWQEEPVKPSVETIMHSPAAFRPELRAELKACIEAFWTASRAAHRAPAVNRPGFFEESARAWQGIGDLLTPVLPLAVDVPEEHRTVEIHEPSQIKMNVVNALYRAVS